MTTAKFWDECRFFRVLPGFVAQWGINGDPNITKSWDDKVLPDEPTKHSNLYGTVTFANAGPNTRTTQIFINYANNTYLDDMGFPPVAEIIEGMDVVERLCGEYSESVSQTILMDEGNTYLQEYFPDLSYITNASLNANYTVQKNLR